MKRISCVIFDLDGTVSQTNELIFESFNHVAGKYVNRAFTPAEIVALFGPPEEVAIERIVGREKAHEAMDEFCRYYEAHHPRLAKAYEGIVGILRELKDRGVLLALFTGKGTRTTRITLRELRIMHYFDMIVTGNDVRKHKPSSDGIRKVLSAFHLPPQEVLMVGDSVSDVKAAREAGVAVAAVLWDSYGREKVMEMRPDLQFEDVREFAAWLSGAASVHGAGIG